MKTSVMTNVYQEVYQGIGFIKSSLDVLLKEADAAADGEQVDKLEKIKGSLVFAMLIIEMKGALKNTEALVQTMKDVQRLCEGSNAFNVTQLVEMKYIATDVISILNLK